MSKTEILEEFAKLPPEDRAEIMDSLWAMENEANAGPTPEEAALLDAELEEYKRDGDRGLPWEHVIAELQKQK